jgi:hypothetical protein
MVFKGFEDLANKKREEFFSHCRPEIIKLYNKKEPNIRKKLKEKNIVTFNSYEQNLLMSLLSDEELVNFAHIYLQQAGLEFSFLDEFYLDASYNEVLKHKIIHLLLYRLEYYVKQSKDAEEAKGE